MQHTFEAVYEGGVLRPIGPLKGLANASHVLVTLEPTLPPDHPMLDCLNTLPKDRAAQLKAAVGHDYSFPEPDTGLEELGDQTLDVDPGVWREVS
ncbi:MAG TPA: antitoxin family protein [Armatimonadota bacterium]|jgi:hypothetical protein